MLEKRQDHQTAAKITEAMNMKRAFGLDAGLALLRSMQVPDDLAREALGEKYERRQR